MSVFQKPRYVVVGGVMVLIFVLFCFVLFFFSLPSSSHSLSLLLQTLARQKLESAYFSIQNNLISEWEYQEEVWGHVYKTLDCESSEEPVLLSEVLFLHPPSFPNKTRFYRAHLFPFSSFPPF